MAHKAEDRPLVRLERRKDGERSDLAPSTVNSTGSNDEDKHR